MREAVVAMIQAPDRRRWLGVARKNDHNDWGLPGGQVEPGEDPMTAVIREILEETGQRVTGAIHVWSAILDGWVVHTFVCTVSNNAVVHPGVGEAPADWKTEEELSRGTFGRFNKERFEQLRNLTDA